MTFLSAGAAGPVVGSPAVGRRLRLKPPGAVKGCFDGAWWPRSREPVAEFSALVTALVADSGPVDRIGFNPAMWDLAPRKLALETGLVRLAGFFGLDRHTIVVIGPRIRRLSLLVVPPEADPAAAERALEAAAAPDAAGSAVLILTTSGILDPPTGTA
ncbi:DUF5994 family protein [Amycolatopsis sp. DG1A-15b]|uniref:DUF5994 family protein n=1 Tax=Amycolatopsis sp. DG1A-15b TaxID=3052846 RepID=UPI00255B921E|nr:DUF5994 family protein [Amycolatopsis sp. DG1A-15b]WIX92191.1 DUF5994 family protein [Amycolatopsis sp. DG1A-15b]